MIAARLIAMTASGTTTISDTSVVVIIDSVFSHWLW